MSDEKSTINELKEEERIKIDIPVDEEATGKSTESIDIAEEFKRLGRQFGATLESIFNSDEARRVEGEVRAGMKSFVEEVEKVINEAKDSPTATRMKEEAAGARERVEAGEFGRKAQTGMVSGLRWLSTELEKLAEQFAPAEKGGEAPAEKSPTE